MTDILRTSAATDDGAPTPAPPRSAVDTADAVQGRDWSRDHAVDLRLSIPLVFGRYYLTIVAGRERRCPRRLAEERRKHPMRTAGNALFLAACGVIVGFALLFLMQTATRLLLASG